MDNNGYLVNADGKYVVGVGQNAAVTSDQYPLAADVIANTAASGNLDITPDTFVGDASPVVDNPTPTGTVTVDPVYTPIRIPTNAQSMSIGQDGTVTFVDADGSLRWAGQLVLAKFPNPGGLTKNGSNYFQESANSGKPFNQVATNEGMGSVNSGFLEMSNVDLSEEFTDMIVAQRGFQANTRIITTSDSILEELINLKR